MLLVMSVERLEKLPAAELAVAVVAASELLSETELAPLLARETEREQLVPLSCQTVYPGTLGCVDQC